MSFEGYLQKAYLDHALTLTQNQSRSPDKEVLIIEDPEVIEKAVLQIERFSPKVFALLRQSDTIETLVTSRKEASQISKELPKAASGSLKKRPLKLPELIPSRKRSPMILCDDSTIIRIQAEVSNKVERALMRDASCRQSSKTAISTPGYPLSVQNVVTRENIEKAIQSHFNRMVEPNNLSKILDKPVRIPNINGSRGRHRPTLSQLPMKSYRFHESKCNI